MSKYSASLIANAFIYRAKKESAKLNHLKLQKLVFFMHVWSLALYGRSTVDTRPQAWTYGPVFDTLYHELKYFGSRYLDGYLVQMNPHTGKLEPQIPVLSDSNFWNLLEQVWNRYSSFTDIQLSELASEAGGPWEKARQQTKLVLDDDEVCCFYRKKLANSSS